LVRIISFRFHIWITCYFPSPPPTNRFRISIDGNYWNSSRSICKQENPTPNFTDGARNTQSPTRYVASFFMDQMFWDVRGPAYPNLNVSSIGMERACESAWGSHSLFVVAQRNHRCVCTFNWSTLNDMTLNSHSLSSQTQTSLQGRFAAKII